MRRTLAAGSAPVQLLRLLARHRAGSLPAHLRPTAITGCPLVRIACRPRPGGLYAPLLELPPAAELGKRPTPDLHHRGNWSLMDCAKPSLP